MTLAVTEIQTIIKEGRKGKLKSISLRGSGTASLLKCGVPGTGSWYKIKLRMLRNTVNASESNLRRTI